MTCQRCITLRNAVSFAHMPNSVTNAIRLQRAEEVHAAKGPDELRIKWTDVPRPDLPELTRVLGSVPAHPESNSDSLYTPVHAWRVWSLVCKHYGNTLIKTMSKLYCKYSSPIC